MNIDIIGIDLLVIGGGIAGLRAAVEGVRKKIKVALVYEGPGASPGIMGFNAPLDENDSEEVFIKDILESGCYINNQKLVKILVDESKEVVKELEDFGLDFDKNNCHYNQLQALGCSYPRVVHHKNSTGILAIKIMKNFLRDSDALILKDVGIFSLLEDNGEIIGAIGFNKKTNRIIVFDTNCIIIATGGCCNIFPISTNTFDTNGDGYAMAYGIGAKLVDMEFIQFEPCCAVYPEKLKGKGMVTTLLNKGGKLYNINNERFMFKYNQKGESVHKNVLARCINMEILSGRGTKHNGVYFDVTEVPKKVIEEEYPLYLRRYLSVGIDIRKTPIEVAPAAHTSLGGIKIDECCSSSVAGLYACGEATGGVHGADRIGGNAGTEVFVFGRRAGEFASEYSLSKVNRINDDKIRKRVRLFLKGKEIDNSNNINNSLEENKKKIQKLLAENAGIVREGNKIKQGLEELIKIRDVVNNKRIFASLADLVKCYKLKNMITTSELVLTAALNRTESRGVHFRKDYPNRDDINWQKNIVLIKDQESVNTTKIEIIS